MDVEMPGMSGIDCARIIQDKNPKAVLVFATAHEQYMKSAFEVYAFDYLVKPFPWSAPSTRCGSSAASGCGRAPPRRR